MPYRARSGFEKDILETFEEKLEKSDDISENVTEEISDCLRETTLSQSNEAEELAEHLIGEQINESE